MLPPDKLSYTILEFCQATGIARTQVFDYIKRGHLKARKSGRRTLILAGDAEAFLGTLPQRKAA
jgi:predicted site-specific integrase-resolvase